MNVPNGQLEVIKKDRIILGSQCGNRVYLASLQQDFAQDCKPWFDAEGSQYWITYTEICSLIQYFAKR